MTLTLKSRGGDVRLLQYALGITTDGVFGNQTLTHLKSSVLFDSSVGGTTTEKLYDYLKLITPEHIVTSHKLLLKNIREIDVDGDGKSDNRGEEIDKMIKFVFPQFNIEDKTTKGYAWCAIFVTYVLFNSYPDVHNKLLKTARAKDMLDWASVRANYIKVTNINQLRRDTIVIGGWVNDNGFGHVYIVDPIESLMQNIPDKVVTIEGNTNNAGSREGDGLYNKVRNIANNTIYQFKL